LVALLFRYLSWRSVKGEVREGEKREWEDRRENSRIGERLKMREEENDEEVIGDARN
jgi:hypothetical protein